MSQDDAADRDRGETEAGHLSVDEAFGALGHPTRIDILKTLYAVRGPNVYDPDAAEHTLLFSELYDRVDYDTASNFTYHLEKLTGHFVRQVEDRYALTYAGLRVVRALVAGTITDITRLPPTEVDAQCPLCGATVELLYKSQLCTIRCSVCAGTLPARMGHGYLFQSEMPPVGLADRPVDQTFHAAVAFALTRIAAQRCGVCPQCSGPVDATMTVCDRHQRPEEGVCPHCGRYHLSELHYGCTECGEGRLSPTRLSLLSLPSVVARYQTQTGDYEFASWAAFRLGMRAEGTLLSADSIRLRFDLPGLDEPVVVDETLTPRDP